MKKEPEHIDLQDNICEETLFASIFNKHAKDLHNFLYYKFGESLNPQDKVQEAFIKLWENCAKVKPSKAKSYVFTIANNLMLNATAHQKVILKYQKIKPKTYTNEDPQYIMEEDQYMQKLQLAISKLSELSVQHFYLTELKVKNIGR